MNRALLLVLLVSLLAFPLVPDAWGHVEDGGNAQSRIVGAYRVGFETYPLFPTAGGDTALIFSISDLSGNHVSNITASVVVAKEGSVLQRYPQQFYRYGDFSVQHVFEREGLHTVTLEAGSGLRAEFDVTVYSESFLWLVNYGGFIVFGVVLVLMGFLYVRGRGKGNMDQRGGAQPSVGASGGYFVRSVLLLSAGGALVLFMVSPLGVSLEEADLSFHMMVQHLGLTGGSVLVMFGGEYLVLGLIGGFRGSSLAGVVGLLYGRVILLNRRLNAGGRVLVPVVAVLLAYWHVPGNFNAAVVDEGLHGLMHVSFLVIGVLVFLCVKVLSLGQLLLYSVVLSQVMMIGGVILISTPVHLYPFYPLQQQRDAGLIMAAPHPFMVALVGVYAFSRYFWRD